MTDEDISSYLEDAGFPPHIVQRGRAGLISRWTEFVGEVERGYPHRLHDYRHDLDIRGVLETLSLSDDPLVGNADARFREMLVASDQRIWESMPGEVFWDYGFPRNAGAALLRDLVAEGFLDENSM